MQTQEPQITQQHILDVPQLPKDNQESPDQFDDPIQDFQTESVANSQFTTRNMFKKTGSKIKFQGMFSMVSESEVTERKDDPMCEHNKVNHDGIFKKVSFNDSSKRLDREGDLSPFPYIPKEKLKMIKSKTKVENLPRQIPL